MVAYADKDELTQEILKKYPLKAARPMQEQFAEDQAKRSKMRIPQEGGESQ